MYNDQKTRNEGQTLCTMIRRQGTKDRHYVQWSEDKERRTNNMHNDQKTRNEGQTICTMIRRQRTKDKQYVQWSEDKERRTNNMYKAYLCTMVRRQGTKDKQGSTKYFTKNERSRNSNPLKTGDGLRCCGRVFINSYCYTLADIGYLVHVRMFLLPTIFCILLFSLLTLGYSRKKTHLIFDK